MIRNDEDDLPRRAWRLLHDLASFLDSSNMLLETGKASMPDNAWWVRLGDEVVGPKSGRELKLLAKIGKLLPDTPVSPDGKLWVPARRLKGLTFKAIEQVGPDGNRNRLPGGETQVAYDAFLSYSTPDKPTADAICATFEREMVRCWIAPRDILPGKNYAEAIIDAINSCRVLVVVLSSASNGSPQVLREVERAVHKGLPIIPFRIEEVTPSKSMEYFLSAPHWLDALTPPMETHISLLSNVVQAVLNGAQTETSAMPNQDGATRAKTPSTQTIRSKLIQQPVLLGGLLLGLVSFIVISVSLGLKLLPEKQANSSGTMVHVLKPVVAEEPSSNEKGADSKSQAPPTKSVAARRPQSDELMEEYEEYRKQVSAGRGSVVFLQKMAPLRYVHWRDEADAGDPIAELFVGRCYQEGLVVVRDEAAAIPWLEKSAAQGNDFAMHTLGLAYERGDAVTPDPAAALQWYTRAANAGNPISMKAIAGLCEGASIGKPNPELALTWYKKAAALGDPLSMRFIGNYYRDGIGGVSKDSRISEDWYKKAAAAGDAYLIGKLLGNRAAPHFASYLATNASKEAKSTALAAIRDMQSEFDNLDLTGFNAVFGESDLAVATATLGDLDSSDPLRHLFDRFIEKYMSRYAAAALSERTFGIVTFSVATASRVRQWYKDKRYDDIAAFWERSYKGVPLYKLDTYLGIDSLIEELNWASASLLRIGQRKEAAEVIAETLDMCDRSLAQRPWNWYVKLTYSGLCFNVADTWIEIGDRASATPLLRRGWTVTLHQYGRESLLEKYSDLPQKGKVPQGATDDEREFFEKFAATADKSKSGMSRFTIPCDFSGTKFPFHVYVLTGPRGYAELQDQFRWVKEVRGGDFPLDVRDSFMRLNTIAKENNVDFRDLCVYALGEKEGGEAKPENEKVDKSKKPSLRK